MTSIKIKSLSEFIAACTEIDNKSGHTLYYRGHASSSFVPLPSVFRHQFDDPAKERFVVREEHLFHNLVTRCPDEFRDCSSTFDCLVKMQHYGLPTRLLDITSNPLVALYFACLGYAPAEGTINIEEDEGRLIDCELDEEEKPRVISEDESLDTEDASSDGGARVLIYQVPDNEIKFYNSDTVSVVSNLARMDANFNYGIGEHQERFLHSIQADKPYFKDKIRKEDLNAVLCVKPKLDNRRIIKQSGAFFLFGMGVNKVDHISIPDKYRSKVKHIDIPEDCKPSLLKELETLAISEATLFPEIDNVARFLKEENITAFMGANGVERSEVAALQDEIVAYGEIIAEKLLTIGNVVEQIRNNSKEQAMQGFFSDCYNSALAESVDDHAEIAVKVMSDTALFKAVEDAVYLAIIERLGEKL